ncbi:MAG TPA: 6-pyruvoyl-tetrahydropterin synthase-related protein, partial [Acidimicrobiia bacterium]|nr:6-pyruvoyl-tetrahydropterin synthase-related protein [Acidimicrobiia bacterium]
WVGLAILAACVAYIFVQLGPSLVLRNTTITGGDTGAHVWFPDFLIDHFLPWRVSGWSNDFYAGFPAGQFYFPFPAVLIALLDIVLPYNVAFKLVTVVGPVALPAGAYVFGRGIRAPRPTAPMLAVAATAFLFFTGGGDETMTFDFHIMGGNLPSTLAGEFSFTIALALSLFFLGALARALDRRGALWLPAVLLALTFMSHVVVAIFAVYAGAVIWLVIRPIKNFTRAAAIAVVGVLLTAFWFLPLATNLGNTTDMRYEPIGNYLDWMFLSENWFLYPLAAVALGAGIWFRRRSTLIVAAITAATGLVFWNWEGLREIFGKAPAWNLRLLPFWMLMLHLLAGLGVAELVRLLATGVTWVIRGDRARAAPVAHPEAAAVEGPELAPSADRPPRFPRHGVRLVALTVLAAITATVCLVIVQNERDFIPYWARYNYTGYEGGSTENFTAKSWPEYRAFLDTANNLPPGRMLWEGGDAIGAYGTPLALMLLPYWTHGRIQSMEGLYFEASTTTPYHFMTVATLAQSPSNPVRGLPYKNIADFDLGVRYLQLMGVRYYAAFTSEAKDKANANPDLVEVATVPDLDGKPPSGWTIYRVKDAPTVQALQYEPVVATGMRSEPSWKCEGVAKPVATGGTEAEFSPWECTAVPWFSDPDAIARPLTDDGPASWTRAAAATARATKRQSLPPVDVSNIRTTESSVEFDVSRTGVPVMVKTSWYPNWEAEGA